MSSSTPIAAGFARRPLSLSSQALRSRAGRRMPRRHVASRTRAKRSTSSAVGVTDTTLGAIDLGKEMAKIKGRELRFRKMVIQPGGIVPWHSHDDRPALIYVAEGEIIEYASNCAGPIHHKAGEIRPRPRAPRTGGRTSATVPVVLFIGDVRHDPDDHHM